MQSRATIPEQKDVQAWQEIERQHGLGKSDKDIWFDAVMNGDREVVGALIRKPPPGFDINQTDANGQTALHKALFSDNAEDMVKLLVDDGRIDMAVLDRGSQSAYDVAVKFGNKNNDELKGIATLLKDKLNGEAKAAQEHGDDKRLDALVKAGADEPKAEAAPAGPERPAPAGGPPTADTKRPEGDTRDAKQIISDSPLLAGLGERERKGLKGRVGDYEKDADAAYRAVAVLNHIERYDEGGKEVLDSDDVGNDKIDGYTKAEGGDATHGSESGRLKDFNEQGYSTLKKDVKPPVPRDPPTADTKRPEGDKRDAKQIIEDNPLLAGLQDREKQQLKGVVGNYEKDPDAAYRASRVLDHIENYDENGQVKDKDGIGNGRLDGYTKAVNGDAQHGTEAGRFKDFVENGYGYLKTYDVNRRTYAESQRFANDLQQDAYKKIIKDAKLPDDRKDIVNHPERYSVQQRYAARLELTLAREKIQAGIEDYNEKGVFYAGDSNMQNPAPEDEARLIKLNTDPKKVLAELNDNVKKLSSDEVDKYEDEHEAKVVQELLRSDPDRAAKARALYDDMKNNAVGLDRYVGDDKDTLDGMRKYVSSVSTLNEALGKDGKPLDEDFTIRIDKNSPEGRKIMEAYRTELQDPEALTKLVKEKGYTEGEAIAEIESRSVLFASFGANPDDVAASVKENITNHALNDVKPDDFKGSGFINDKGEVDERFINDTLDKLRKEDPNAEILKDEKGQPVSNAQIITGVRGGWDAFRNASKVNAATGKADIKNLKQFFDKNSGLQKTFGTGLMHGVSSLLAAGISIARSETGQKLSLEAKIAAAGNGIQAFGVATQGFEFTQRSDPKVIEKIWGAPPDKGKQPAGDPKQISEQTKAKATNIMNFGKVLNGTGGAMAGAAGIALGVEALKKGDKAGAGLFLTQGISNTLTALGPLAEAAAPKIADALGKNPADFAKTNGRMFIGIGSASLVLNIVAGAAVVGYVIYDAVRNEDRRRDYFDSFTPTLKDYGITGGKDEYWTSQEGNVPFPV